MARVLIIAYGNPLRSDDGVAWRAAEQLQHKFPSHEVDIRTMHQLTPELAEYVAHHKCVIFIDAAAESSAPGHVEVNELCSADSHSALGHALTPTVILSLAEKLYHSSPRAFSVTVSGQNFGHGESLSSPVQAAIPDLISCIEQLVKHL
jgi:hydrogenase maturation protease